MRCCAASVLAITCLTDNHKSDIDNKRALLKLWLLAPLEIT